MDGLVASGRLLGAKGWVWALISIAEHCGALRGFSISENTGTYPQIDPASPQLAKVEEGQGKSQHYMSLYPRSCFHCARAPAQPCSPFFYTDSIPFSKGKPAYGICSSKYFSVSFQLLSKKTARTLLFTPFQTSGALPRECSCAAWLTLIRELGTQGKLCAARLRE